MLTWNLLALNIGFPAYILARAYFEERKLLGDFGDAYAQYLKRTPMLIPFIKRGRSKQQT
jgi:protein-S-isoprenylcysteine O-methyltransferase Ste14